MNVSAGTGVFVLSLLSIPLSYVSNLVIYTGSPEAILGAATLLLLLAVLLSRMFVQKKAPKDPLFYVFAVYAFLSVVNLIIGLEQDGIIDGFMTFYVKQADPYINTAHGHMISYWDGCTHYLMYLLMVAAITWGESYRAIGLYWVGSLLMRVIVYIPGNVVGKYGTQLSPTFIGHLLYVAVSVWTCFRVFSQPSTREVSPAGIQEAHRKSLVQRPLDFLFAIYLIPATAFCIFRGLVALDCPNQWCREYLQHYEPYLRDPSAYPKIQMLVNMFYSVPYYVVTLYGLVVPGCEWMPDLALVHSGAVAQAQFSHLGASFHTRTPFAYRAPEDNKTLVLMVNALYGLVPQILTYRCVSNPAFFFKLSHDKKTE
ncbi:transmembrane 6 superfamily member 1-like isoform X1 [Scleropages formosus]|uniref:Transmembrane 6 superfamily member 1 n=1 Tax=Scleropages formosus TaxID=113540 RepID=A0A8C9RWL2_SCLFO|nr:transmembrane 6 superfamily member 1 isoform X1 [Scleropages formosus]